MELLQEWHAVFGTQPPEWVCTGARCQDVGKALDEVEARIERLRDRLSEELFLLEWLQRKSSASCQNEPEDQPTGAIVLLGATDRDLDGGGCGGEEETALAREDAEGAGEVESLSSPAGDELHPRDEVDVPAISPESVPVERKHSPLQPLGSRKGSEESLRSSDYYSAQQHLSAEQQLSTSASEENSPELPNKLARTRSPDSSSDERVRLAVRRRLIEQSKHWSCQFLDHRTSESQQSPAPESAKLRRSLSDSSLDRGSVRVRSQVNLDLQVDTLAFPPPSPSPPVKARLPALSPDSCETTDKETIVVPSATVEGAGEPVPLSGESCEDKESGKGDTDTAMAAREVSIGVKLRRKGGEAVELAPMRTEDLSGNRNEIKLVRTVSASSTSSSEREFAPCADSLVPGESDATRKRYSNGELKHAVLVSVEPEEEEGEMESTVEVRERRNSTDIRKRRESDEQRDSDNSSLVPLSFDSPSRPSKGVYTKSLYWASERDNWDDHLVLIQNGKPPSVAKETISEADEELPETPVSAPPCLPSLSETEEKDSRENTPKASRYSRELRYSNGSIDGQPQITDLPPLPGRLVRRKMSGDEDRGRGAVFANRNSAYLDLDDEECTTPKGENDPSMSALTRETVELILSQNPEMKHEDSGEDSSGLDDSLGSAGTPHVSLTTSTPIAAVPSHLRGSAGMSMFPLFDPAENREMNALLPSVCSEPNLVELGTISEEESIEIDEATISAITLGTDLYGSRSNSVSSLPGLLASCESFTADLSASFPSPAHQGVNLRSAKAAKGRERKRMGNAELDQGQMDYWEGVLGSGSKESSPTHTASSRTSNSPVSEESYSLPMSPSSPQQPTPDFSPPSSPCSTSSQSSTRSSHIFPVRRSTVVVHGEVLVIRKLVVAGIVTAEKNYIDCLSVMREYYRKPLLARATTSQPIMSEREVNTIFYRVDDLHDLHTRLHEKLESQLIGWCLGSCVGEFFVDLCRKLRLYKDYVEMSRRSLECLDRCKTESANFRKFLEDVHATVQVHYKEVPKVNELLRRPIERLQSYSLVLNDLCQHTPDDHPDYQVLRQSLQAMADFIASTHDPQSFRQLSGGFNRELVKEGLMVELSDGIRKIRRVFLFHDVLISSKQKPSRNGMKFEPKWHLPLNQLRFHQAEKEARRPVPVTSDMELSVMKNKIAELKAQLNKDPSARDRVTSQPERDGSFKRNIGGLRALHTIKSSKSEKAKKKLQEQKVSYWVAAPSLPLRLYSTTGKCYVFLLHSEEERENWLAAIKKLQPKVVGNVTLTSFELQDLLGRQNIHDLRVLEEMKIPTGEDEYLSGILRLRVQSASGLKAKPAGLYCCLELDEYGKFDRKARTLPTSTDATTLAAIWDQDFEVEITGTHIMKVLVCSKSLLKEECYANGKIRLPIHELKTNKRHKTEVKLYPQGTLSLVIEYFSSLSSISRKPAMMSSGVFGVPLEIVAKRERHDIPLIVQTCVDEVERRGLSEVGIYRVAGVMRDVKELREAFDSDYLKAQVIAFETDIHAVAGLLKRYFRELPDPLFTDELYINFVHGLRLSDPAARTQCMITLLHSLPPVNFKTAVFLFRHLKSVAANSKENKMTLNNLSTVYGPNLLRPATATTSTGETTAVDIITPVSVVLYYLNCSEEYYDEDLFKSSSDTATGRDSRRESQSSRRDSQGSRRDSQSSQRDSQGSKWDGQASKRDSHGAKRDNQVSRRDGGKRMLLSAGEEVDTGFTGGMLPRSLRDSSAMDAKRESVI